MKNLISDATLLTNLMILHFLLPFIYISLTLLSASLISGYVYPGYGFLPPLNASTPLISRTGCPFLWPNDGSLLCENGGFMYNYSVSQSKADYIVRSLTFVII